MKAASRFTGAVSAAALSVGLVMTGSLAFQMGAVAVAEAAVVNRIEVSGNQRVDADAVRGQVGIRPGQNVSSADVDEAVKRLFDTGLFSDVRISQSGSTLNVVVVEHSVINQVLFEGNRRLKDADLRRAIQSEPRGAFSRAMLDADVEALRQAYGRAGRDGAVVNARVDDLGSNRVNVVFDIQEGGRTKISAINFEGNEAFGDSRLRDVIATKRSSFMSFLTRNDIYDEDRLRADEELLRRFYYDRGYADFYVVSAHGTLDEASNQYRIDFTVDEGARYRFGGVDVESTIAGVDSASLDRLVATRSGEWYSASDVEKSIVALTEHLAGIGYPFAQVTPRGDRDFSNQTISVAYAIDQGARAYIERIEIRGNQRTRDHVVRREFDVSEGDAFNQVLIQRAKRRLDALDYFESVQITTLPGAEPDRIIVVVDLVEKSTGEFTIGGGYTTGGGANNGLSLEAGIAERNFMGRGQAISLSVSGGENARNFTLSFTEPYFLGHRVSAGFDLYRQTRRYSYYESETNGGTVRLGLPITEDLSVQFAYNLSEESYSYRGSYRANCLDDDGNYDPNRLNDAGNYTCRIGPVIWDAVEGQGDWIKSSGSVGLVYNTLDDPRNPRQGTYATFTTEVAGIGGDAQFVSVTGRATHYQPLSDQADIIGLVTVGGGHIEGLGSDKLRVFDLFQSSNRIIRGFDTNGIGPRQARNPDNPDSRYDFLGGQTYLHATAEAQFPLPGVSEGLGLRGAVFADAATLYGADIPDGGFAIEGTSSKWRASVGAGLLWASPFGPLRVDYAVPVAKEDGDKVQNFSFGMSSRF